MSQNPPDLASLKFLNGNPSDLAQRVTKKVVRRSSGTITNTHEIHRHKASTITVGKFLDTITVAVKKPTRKYNIISEILAGYTLNPLRGMLPNFMYMYGTVQSDSEVLMEYVPGIQLENAFADMTEETCIGIFLQLAIALETAQNYCSFTHYDLHTQNILITQDDLTYTVPMGPWDVTVKTHKNIPVIIDFGFTTVHTKHGHHVHNAHNLHEKYGIIGSFVPGYDLYRLLLFSLDFTTRDSLPIAKTFAELFRFYGKNDKHNLADNPKQAMKISRFYGREGTYSKIASTTPREFVLWIQKTYPKIFDKYVTINDRKTVIPPLSSNNIAVREKMAEIYKDEWESADNMRNIKLCSSHYRDSYLQNSLNFALCQSTPLYEHLNPILHTFVDRKIGLDNDKQNMQLVLNDEYPDPLPLCRNILDRSVGWYDEETLKPFLHFHKQWQRLEDAMQMIYTIRQLGKENEYSAELNAPAIAYYNKYWRLVTRIKRWIDALRDYMTYMAPTKEL